MYFTNEVIFVRKNNVIVEKLICSSNGIGWPPLPTYGEVTVYKMIMYNCLCMTYRKCGRFTGLNFRVFHGFQKYSKSFSTNISASL